MEIPTEYLVKVHSIERDTAFYKLRLSQEMVNCLMTGVWKSSEIFCFKLRTLLEHDCNPYTQVRPPLSEDTSPAFEIAVAEVDHAMRQIELEHRINAVWYYRWQDGGQYVYGCAKKTTKATRFHYALRAGKWTNGGVHYDCVYSFFMEEIEPIPPDAYYQAHAIEIPVDAIFAIKLP